MRYISQEDCKIIFETIQTIEYDDNPEYRPQYQNENSGLEKFNNLLERVKTPYYSGFYQKAAFLFVSINKGHYFSNGNKRLALVTTELFIRKNSYKFKSIEAEIYMDFLSDHFSDSKLEWKPQQANTIIGFAMYNLNKLIAANQPEFTFDKLKEIAELFLKLSTTKD